MPPALQNHFASLGIGTEILYSFVIIVSCLIIYFGTKELYDLSSYKGINYFRLSFLFFAVAFFFRSFIKIILVLFNTNGGSAFSPTAFGITTSFIFMYFSSIAVYYLFYSLIWKKWESKLNNIYFGHLSAFVISFISIIFNEIWLYIFLNLAILISGTVLIYIKRYKEDKKKLGLLYLVYLLLTGFFILNIIDLFISNFLQPYQLLVYIISIGIFMSILYKVLKKTGTS